MQPSEVVGTVLMYLGKDPKSKSPEDLQAAEKVLLSIRPYLRYMHSSRYIDDLANGETCLALGWSGDVKQARDRAQRSRQGHRDRVPHSQGRHHHELRHAGHSGGCAAPEQRARCSSTSCCEPEVAAKNSNLVKYANVNTASTPLLADAVKDDPEHLSAAGDAGEAGPGAAAARRNINAPADAHVDALQDRQMSADRPVSTQPSGQQAPYLRIENVTKRFGDFVAVNDVSLDVQQGEIFCLLGGSGSGKTTLLRMLAGFETPTSGKIYIDGQDMSEIRAVRAAGQHDVPVLRALPAHDGREERGVRPGAGAARQGRDPAPGGRDPRDREDDARSWPASRTSSPAASGSAWRWRAPW